MTHPAMKSAAAAAAAFLVCGSAAAQSPASMSPWMSAVSAVIGTPGKLQPDGVLMWNLIRTDLPLAIQITRSPSAGTYPLAHAMASGMLSFQPAGAQRVAGAPRTVATVEFALPEHSANTFADVLRTHGMQVSALHNHYLDDDPKIVFVHAGGLGDPVQQALAVRAAWQAVQANVHPDGKPDKDDTVAGLDPEHLGHVLGGTGEALDGIADVTVSRNETVTLAFGADTVAIEPEMGPQSDFEFQPLGDGRAVVVGELCVTADEAPAVMKSLRASRIEVDALHNHFLSDQPRLFFMHVQAAGVADDIASSLRKALDLTNSER